MYRGYRVTAVVQAVVREGVSVGSGLVQTSTRDILKHIALVRWGMQQGALNRLAVLKGRVLLCSVTKRQVLFFSESTS